MKHIVEHHNGRAYVDRRTLARLLGRSVHTIRARCTVQWHTNGRAMYDAEACERVLSDIPTRDRQAA